MRAMRLTTVCSEMPRWLRVAAAACVVLLWHSGGAIAADSEAIGPAALRYTATCARAGTFRAVIDVGHTAPSNGGLVAPRQTRRPGGPQDTRAPPRHHDGVPG